MIDLDSPRYADREALLAYTMRSLLQSRSSSPYRSADPLLLRGVAQAVADAADTSFLVAHFAAYTLASADTVVADPHDPRWRASLPLHAGQAMRDDLTRRLGPDAQRATDLLRPLAYAEGRGLPWEDIWAPLASAVSGSTYTDEDLLWLRHHAGSYVVEATESGRSAYRLYHQVLTDYLREDIDATEVHSAFVDVLAGCVPYRGDATRDWSRAHPYTLSHLAAHAAAAGRFDGLLSNTEYLVHADPHSLTPHLRQASGRQVRLTAAVYRNSFDLHADASVSVRRSILTLNAARAGATTLLEQLNRCAPASEWVPVWATGNDFTQALRTSLTGLDSWVMGMTCSVLGDGSVALISGGREGVSLWDLATGRRIGKPLTDPLYAVGSMACTVLDGRPIAVIGGGTNAGGSTVTMWDLTSGRRIGEFVHGPGPVLALACTVLDGQPVAVIGGDTVTVWDLASGHRVGRSVTPTVGNWSSQVHTLACTMLGDRAIAVVGGPALSMLDLTNAHRIGEPYVQEGQRVHAVACTYLDGRAIAVIGGRDLFTGTVFVWDLASGRRIGQLEEFDGRVNSVGCTILNGQPIAVTGTTSASGTGHARVWDLRTQKLLQHFVLPDLQRVEVAPDGSLVVLLGRDIAVLQPRSDWLSAMSDSAPTIT